MHPALDHVDHRPWPLPEAAWNWRQRWCDLLFAHWPVPVATLQPLVHLDLQIQEFEGTSWVGVVPFRMEDVMLRRVPGLPGISNFLELNLRLYVTYQGRPGVWFLSLDASNPPAVWAARTFFHLPYFRARMRITEEADGTYDYLSTRVVGGAQLEARYRPTGEVYASQPGTLEHWLTERYMLYTQDAQGRLCEAHIHHAPWPLQPAEASFGRNELCDPHGFQLGSEEPLLHFSKRIDVVVWNLERSGTGG